MKRALLLPLACATALSLPLTSAWSSSEWPDYPRWAVRKAGYDASGASAMLSPSNDTRVNLALLLADRGTAAKGGARTVPLFDWSTLAAELAPNQAGASTTEGAGSRCQTNASGAQAFAAAVAANRSLSETEKRALSAARGGLKPDCEGGSPAPIDPALDPALAAASSAQARQFAGYLRGAAQFYQGEFAAATSAFAGLANAGDPWLRETALYMAARSELNRAQQSAFDRYGGIASPRTTDPAAAVAALGRLQAYLKVFPQGRYAASANGLIRRVHWLAGNERALAASYGDLLARAAPGQHAGIAQEIDDKLLLPADRSVFTDPLILAASNLRRMRQPDEAGAAESGGITRTELEGQRSLFAGAPQLHSYLLAAEALYGRNQPREVLALIPDAARQPRFSYLQFSRQMLRGMALEAAGDRNARGFWLELFGGASQPWQREALELALALHEERNGGLARVFAPNSKIRNPAIREILLDFVAGPEILRQLARSVSASKRERESALYILLAKDLGHGFYADFLRDVKLIEPGAGGGRQYYGVHEVPELYGDNDNRVPLGLFTGDGELGDIGCPGIAETAARLARAPQAATPRLCLAEFMRANGFDDFPFDTPLRPDELGGTRSLFPGGAYQRQAVYRAVMADRAASAEDKAYALYRAVRCYAPNGTNDCGGADVPVAQRRAWFNRLKAEFPRSRWARSLQHYW